MRLQKIIMINRAPFEHLELDFNDENVVILSGINGAGKTTIISHIIDAFYEFAKKAYENEFEDKPNKYYRVSSTLYSIDANSPSIVYFRFARGEKGAVDYIDARGTFDQASYDQLIVLSDKIPYASIKRELDLNNNTKHWSLSDKKEIDKIFSESLMTYFPAYRYETPSYLNDPYKVSLSFNTSSLFSGYLSNPIEVISDLPQIANWIMDIVLDQSLYPRSTNQPFVDLNEILNHILFSKLKCNTRFGIGPRHYGAQRIGIMSRENPPKQVYPSIFAMSSGELALLCLFGELVKQSDSINKTIDKVTGIVLVDEIDKHLHVRLQKEMLPRLIALFPKVQFIVTSHSPFFGLGLAESNDLSYQVFDLNNNGIPCPPRDNDLFKEVYGIMICENDRYYEQLKSLQAKIQSDSKPLIITEGKTDWKHIKAAMKALKIEDLDIEFHEYEDGFGDKSLMSLLQYYSRIPQSRKIVCVFDRDNLSEKDFTALAAQEYVEYTNNVYAFAIPAVNTDEYGDKISIEHYYKRTDLTKKDKNGRRLFLGDEFFDSGNSKDGKYHAKVSIQKKIAVNGVIDEKVYDREKDLEEQNSIALPKDDFANYIFKEDEFAQGFDFSSFNSIFDVIRKILSQTTEDKAESQKA